MCDTDSLVCNVDTNKYEHLKNRYQPDGCGDKLGTIKNELNDKLIKRMKRKTLK